MNSSKRTFTIVFREHSGNIQGKFKEHSGNIQGTFSELEQGTPYCILQAVDSFNVLLARLHADARRIPGTWEHSGNIQGTFREHSVNIQ
jgi:hypothetical protein